MEWITIGFGVAGFTTVILALVLILMAARAQLGYALRLAPDEVAKERIRTEQRQVEGAARALGQL